MSRNNFSVQVSLLIKTKLKENLGKHKTEVTKREGIKLTRSKPMTWDLEPSVGMI